jgi:heme exporter protein D
MATVWLLVVVGGPLLLLAAILYGVFQYRNRDKRMDAASDASARQVRREVADEDPNSGRR